MNVGFAWSLAPKWSCLIAVMQCASNAIAIGNYYPDVNINKSYHNIL
jgi:hypothetical protein